MESKGKWRSKERILNQMWKGSWPMWAVFFHGSWFCKDFFYFSTNHIVLWNLMKQYASCWDFNSFPWKLDIGLLEMLMDAKHCHKGNEKCLLEGMQTLAQIVPLGPVSFSQVRLGVGGLGRVGKFDWKMSQQWTEQCFWLKTKQMWGNVTHRCKIFVFNRKQSY